MKRLAYSFLISMLLISQCFAANEWQKGTGENVILGTENAADIDTISFNNIVDPLDRILSNYRQGCKLVYSSADILSVSAGEVVCSKADGTIRKFRSNTSAITTSWTVADNGLDAGVQAGSTTYYVFAVADTDATTFTIVISLSSTAPTGKTYIKRLGSFYNDTSSNITLISNDGFFTDLGDWVVKAKDTTYQALTDGDVQGYGAYTTVAGNFEATVSLYTDGSSTPTTLRQQFLIMETGTTAQAGYDHAQCFSMRVKKGDYYKVVVTGSTLTTFVMYWIPQS